MTALEVQKILARLLGAFPQMKLDDAATLVYAEAISRFDADVALFAAKQLIDHCDRFPTVSQLVTTCKAEQRRLEAMRPSLPAPKIETYKTIGLAGVAEARAALKNRTIIRREDDQQ